MHVLEIVAGVGAIQGALLLGLIVLRFRSRKNVPLALFLMVFSLRLGTIPSWNPTDLRAFPWLYPMTAPLPFLFGPLLWWYAWVAVRNSETLPRWLPLHFLPYVAEVTAVIVTVIRLDPVMFDRLVGDVFSGNPPGWLPARNALKVAVNVVYVGATARLAFGRPGAHVSGTLRLWLRGLVMISLLSLGPFAFVAVWSPASAGLVSGSVLPFILVAVGMAILVYAVTVLVLVAPEVPACSDVGVVSGPRTQTLPDETCHHLAERVRRFFDDGGYADPGMSESRLAERFGVHPNRLSAAVNLVFERSFRAVLNRKRIECFIRCVESGGLAGKTILEVAYDCGFPSKSTFNRVFKEAYGVSPSVWIEKNR